VVHFIGPSKPWQRLHRSRSGPSDDNDIYAELFDLWLDVYERHFGQMPVVTPLPSLPADAQTGGFTVPRVSSVWDDPHGESLAYRPPSPDKLENMLGTNAESLAAAYRWRLDRREGKYTSMPLEDRLRLALVSLGSTREHPHHSQVDVESTASDNASVISDLSKDFAPSTTTTTNNASWNPERSSLPKDDRLQMKDPPDLHYSNVWDEPTPQADALFEPPPYAPIPESIQSRYEDVMSSAPAPAPSSSSSAANNNTAGNRDTTVFPWEAAPPAARPLPARVFPATVEPSPPSPQASRSRGLRPAASSSSPQLSSSARSYFVNAWDSIEGINKYADNLRESILHD
jgi:hypothetical protein